MNKDDLTLIRPKENLLHNTEIHGEFRRVTRCPVGLVAQEDDVGLELAEAGGRH